MKRLIAASAAACLIALSAGSGQALAAAPTVGTSLDIVPHSKIYKEVPRPVSLHLTTTVTPPAGAATLKPLVNVKLKFPPGLTYVPNDSRTPICTAITPGNTNFPTDTAIDLCGDSIVGDGTARLFIAQQTAIPSNDSRILMFNAGRDKDGNPVMNLHGYSPSLNTGIFMTGTLVNGIFDVKIPRLTADSSVAAFTNDIPGDLGKDPDYAQASCPAGNWDNNGVITIAKRDASGVISESEDLVSPVDPITCQGLAGSAKFAPLKVKGPKAVKSGQKGTFRVTVRNTGTASAKKVKVTASGAGNGSASGGKIKPGASKTVTVKAKVTGKKGRKATLQFKATGGASSTGNIKVTVG